MPVLSANLMIFTDLDGSLLDHDTYNWEPARPWLARLRQWEIPVIITTSKTAAEVEQLQNELGLSHLPYIAENGALIVLPPAWCAHPDYPRKVFDADYPAICARLHQIRERESFQFKGFADMDNEAVAGVTGLSLEDAGLARQREASEPLLWLDDATALARFRQCLAEYGLSLTQGGRFYHVMGQRVSKGQAAIWIKKQYADKDGTQVTTFGLGDGPNDISLLTAMDFAILIKGKGIQLVELPPDYVGKLYRTQAMGPVGWSEGLTHFIGDDFSSTKPAHKA
ncbi:mannosyl-3-phosphoglycerate phosphatase|uniref:Mannosyl-3-phosphoglycerate phosphatase n=1 Tax=Brenneria salicis ATCC 15712 = DSM 30166 TaxID=714314 RepID=A0A366I886_9GAMM|nr:mannosyl-3-phosphoglycerate phosphatase-related protein [Brenneria salicis]NMN91689.1 mannosyl-3-phosphoglycerate phosphatase [Brenneria salicis ATCC 15712 = DSM 30166]RBP65747.1 mannosyl-3-phosphoglycerate phosphatase [Brenneria salicis ATCC 15712 = DSM 30166]RLM31790.1 mannosyl-3-phosphoglycerate phosphatase [Brenneria salicis ATCC 15712 = DSM 30166]